MSSLALQVHYKAITLDGGKKVTAKSVKMHPDYVCGLGQLQFEYDIAVVTVDTEGINPVKYECNE